MVKVKVSIVLCGIICLTAIYLALLILDRNMQIVGELIIGIIALAIGVVIPTPKIDNKKGELKWGKK